MLIKPPKRKKQIFFAENPHIALTEPPWHKPMVVNVTVVGPFEEEEEGTGVPSDVVKVEGEDPATPGPLP